MKQKHAGKADAMPNATPLHIDRQRDYMSIFSAFSTILAEHSGTKDITAATIQMLSSAFKEGCGCIHVFNRKHSGFALMACEGCNEDVIQTIGDILAVERLGGEVVSTRRPVLIDDTSSDPRMPEPKGRALSMRSLAVIPVVSSGEVWGVLSLASRHAPLSEMDMRMLLVLAGQLGMAVEKATLIEELHEKMNQLELIEELSGTVNSSLSIGTIFRIIVSELKKLVEYDRASLLLYDEESDDLLIYALDTEMKTVMSKGVRAPIQGTSAGWVIRHNEPWINRDLGDKVRFSLDRKLFDEGIRSTISIPLSQDKILGVFNLDSTKPDTYSEKHLEILLPAAKHIAIALENALLFNEISRERKEWRKTFDAITDMVWIEDLGQRVVRTNQALLNKTGLSAAEVTGIGCGELLGHIGLARAGCLCRDTIISRGPTFKELKTEEGLIFNFWAYPLLDDEGRLYAVVHYLKDVTSQRRLEQQLVRADKLASLGTLVAGIAHEINNPLGIIAGYSEALLDRARDNKLRGMKEFEDFPEYLEMIHREIFRCKEILGGLLEFSRPHRGKARELDINELLQEVILLVKHRAKRLHFELKLDLNRELPKIHAEPGSLRQLFMNIIINSMYFTPEGGTILIRTEMDKTGDEGGMISVAISDTGPGIPQEIMDRIFDPFFTTKPIGEGTGLGLSISHKIAQEHGGKIDVNAEHSTGTTFIVRLPTKTKGD